MSTNVTYQTINSKPFFHYDNDEVLKWLDIINFESYRETFKSNKITGADLIYLNNDDIKTNLQILNLHDRYTLLREVKKLMSSKIKLNLNFDDQKIPLSLDYDISVSLEKIFPLICNVLNLNKNQWDRVLIENRERDLICGYSKIFELISLFPEKFSNLYIRLIEPGKNLNFNNYKSNNIYENASLKGRENQNFQMNNYNFNSSKNDFSPNSPVEKSNDNIVDLPRNHSKYEDDKNNAIDINNKYMRLNYNGNSEGENYNNFNNVKNYDSQSANYSKTTNLNLNHAEHATREKDNIQEILNNEKRAFSSMNNKYGDFVSMRSFYNNNESNQNEKRLSDKTANMQNLNNYEFNKFSDNNLQTNPEDFDNKSKITDNTVNEYRFKQNFSRGESEKELKDDNKYESGNSKPGSVKYSSKYKPMDNKPIENEIDNYPENKGSKEYMINTDESNNGNNPVGQDDNISGKYYRKNYYYSNSNIAIPETNFNYGASPLNKADNEFEAANSLNNIAGSNKYSSELRNYNRDYTKKYNQHQNYEENQVNLQNEPMINKNMDDIINLNKYPENPQINYTKNEGEHTNNTRIRYLSEKRSFRDRRDDHKGLLDNLRKYQKDNENMKNNYFGNNEINNVDKIAETRDLLTKSNNNSTSNKNMYSTKTNFKIGSNRPTYAENYKEIYRPNTNLNNDVNMKKTYKFSNDFDYQNNSNTNNENVNSLSLSNERVQSPNMKSNHINRENQGFSPEKDNLNRHSEYKKDEFKPLNYNKNFGNFIQNSNLMSDRYQDKHISFKLKNEDKKLRSNYNINDKEHDSENEFKSRIDGKRFERFGSQTGNISSAGIVVTKLEKPSRMVERTFMKNNQSNN